MAQPEWWAEIGLLSVAWCTVSRRSQAARQCQPGGHSGWHTPGPFSAGSAGPQGTVTVPAALPGSHIRDPARQYMHVYEIEWHICMYIDQLYYHIRMYVHCAYMHIYSDMHVLYVYARIFMYISKQLQIYMHIHTYTFICALCMYEHTYRYVYTYIYE